MLYGVKGPTGVHVADDHRTERHHAAGDEKIITQEIQPGNATSADTDHDGMIKLPSTEGIEGIRKNHTMSTRCRVNSLL